MQSNAVGWFEIYVQDMARARRFYEAVFARPLEKLDAPMGEMWAFPRVEGAYGIPGALVKMPGVDSGGTSTLVYFTCVDCAIEAARVAGAGGQVKHDKFPIGQYGFIVVVEDTEGNTIGLHSLR
ncbi:MAG: VOC family protein [Burkholderiaceae bacterium]